jgi:Phage integrase family
MATAREVGRYGHRDATIILIAYRHGLRASELCDLRWHQVELSAGRLLVRRSKRGTPGVHPMQGDEIRALRRLQREQGPTPYAFASESGGPMSPKSFGTLFARLGERAGMAFPVFPHTVAATRWPTPATTPGRCRLGSATRTSSTRCAIPNSRRTASRISGGTEPPTFFRSPAGGTSAPIWALRTAQSSTAHY